MYSQSVDEIMCSLCGGPGPFSALYEGASLRETKCPHCGATRRNRDVVRVLLREACGEEALPLAHCLDRLSHLHILEFQAQGPIYVLLRALPFYRCTEYIESVPSGGHHPSGLLSQDLHCLTLPDGAFDLVITQDVFEHVEDPWLGFTEVDRILKPGGKHIFTVPVHEGRPTCTRVTRAPSGELLRCLPEVYHGDPIRAAGSLVFTDFGDDIPERLEKLGIAARVALHATFYQPEAINLILTEEDRQRYYVLHARDRVLQFFLYNSLVLVAERRAPLPSARACRVRFSPVADSFQLHAAEDLRALIAHRPEILTLRGETVTFHGRNSLKLDFTLGKEGKPCAVFLMVEVCWGEKPLFIFPSICAAAPSLAPALAAQAMPLLARMLRKGNLPLKFFISGTGRHIFTDAVSERMLPGVSSYYTALPHLRRYAFVKEQGADLRSVLDVGCGVGYGLGVLQPREGTGLDIAGDALDWGRGVLPSPALRWLRTSVEQAPTTSRYSTITCFEHVEHLEDHTPLMNMISTCLEPGGNLFLSIPNPEFHGKELNHFHKRDFSFAEARELCASYFHDVCWFWQSDAKGDLSQRFLIKAGNRRDAQFWIAKCSRPRER